MQKLLIALLLIVATRLHAYPNFVSYGYNACLSCHYNPYGNGPLTDYGRALGATLISDRKFHKKSTSEEVIGKNSGFFFSAPEQTWFRPSMDYRGLYYKKGMGTDNEKNNYIHMDANLTVVLKAGENDKYIMVGNIGYAPLPIQQEDLDEPTWRSREHYIGFRPNMQWGLYAGLMDKTFGIRVPDHIAFSRSVTGLSMNDQAHGVLIHNEGKSYNIGIHTFIGNLVNDKETRQKGFATKIEYSVTEDTRIGASYLSSKSDFLEKYVAAFHARTTIEKGSSLLFEVGQQSKTAALKNRETTSLYSLIQNQLKLSRGLATIMTIEYLKADSDRQDSIYRFGPGLQYFPSQGLELRFDLYNTRTVTESSVVDDNWDFAGQVHLWF